MLRLDSTALSQPQLRPLIPPPLPHTLDELAVYRHLLYFVSRRRIHRHRRANTEACEFKLILQRVHLTNLRTHALVDQFAMLARRFDFRPENRAQRDWLDACSDLLRLRGQRHAIGERHVGCAVDRAQLRVRGAVRQVQCVGGGGVGDFAVGDDRRHGDAP